MGFYNGRPGGGRGEFRRPPLVRFVENTLAVCPSRGGKIPPPFPSPPLAVDDLAELGQDG